MLILSGGYNIASISEIAETWLRIAQMSQRIEITGDIYKIIIIHDMGQKYSYLIREISRYLLEVAFKKIILRNYRECCYYKIRTLSYNKNRITLQLTDVQDDC